MSEALTHAWRAMVHPATWVCILVLLLNDQLLRWRWPSWLTGKLGDVVWLAFAPLVVALGLAALVRLAFGRAHRPAEGLQDAVILVSIALVGGVFAVIKTVPTATALFHTGFSAVFGWQPLLVRDPTDLLTLPALGLAWVVWRDSAKDRREARFPARAQAWRPFRLTGWAWGALGLALLATLGNSGPPDAGIVCVEKVGERLVAGPHYGYAYTRTYESIDGGLTWAETSFSLAEGAEPACELQQKPWTVVLPGDLVQYHILPGRGIQGSADGGATWTTELSLSGTEARLAYIQSSRGNVEVNLGPHSAVFDPITGNLILAMGFEGVLVRRDALTAPVSGTWQWAPVGDYRYERPTGVEAVTGLLRLEAWLALSAGLLTVTFWGWSLFRWPIRAVTTVWSLAIAGVLLILRPALLSGYAVAVGTLACLGLAVGSLILAIVAGVRIWQRAVPGGWPELLRAVAVGSVAAVLFLVPLAFWAVGVLSYYTMAMWIAIIVVGLIWGYAGTRGGKDEGASSPSAPD
jgi:hypothetical protein